MASKNNFWGAQMGRRVTPFTSTSRPHLIYPQFARLSTGSRGQPYWSGQWRARVSCAGASARLETALAQGALQEARRVDLFGELALDRPGLAF